MAVLGVQIAVTMVVASLMAKVGPFFSFGRWLLASRGLVRYMHPSDGELRALASLPRDRGKKSEKNRDKKGQRNGKPSAEDELEIFHVPRSIDVQLETTRVTLADVVQLRFYAEFQWLFDFAVYTVLVYAITEVYEFYFPSRASQEMNLSMVWCLLCAGFAYKMLASLSGLYFQGGQESEGERSLVIIMGLVYLLLAMLVLVLDESTLETGLDEAYSSFNRSVLAFLNDNQNLDSSGPASKLVLKLCLAVWCGSIGALFTFPGLRMARMQWDVLRYSDGVGTATVLAHAAFVAPLLLTTLWVSPIARDTLTLRTYSGMDKPMMTSDQFETLRLYLILGVILLRLAVMPRYLQSYLNVAYHKVEEIKQEAGKISNLDLQRTVARVFYYLCVVTLQYITPMVLILSLTLMYKTMGGGSWTGLFVQDGGAAGQSPLAYDAHNKVNATDSSTPEDGESASRHISLGWKALKQVFTTPVFRGLLGFSTWWACLAWFLSSAIGLTYQSYFAKI